MPHKAGSRISLTVSPSRRDVPSDGRWKLPARGSSAAFFLWSRRQPRSFIFLATVRAFGRSVPSPAKGAAVELQRYTRENTSRAILAVLSGFVNSWKPSWSTRWASGVTRQAVGGRGAGALPLLDFFTAKRRIWSGLVARIIWILPPTSST